MTQIETELEENSKSAEDLEEELETESATDFLDVRSPEDLTDERSNINPKTLPWAIPMGLSAVGAPFAVPLGLYSGVKGFENIFEGATIGLIGGAAATGIGAKSVQYLDNVRRKKEERLKEIDEDLEKWYEIPGPVDLSYLVDSSVETDFERPYGEWLMDNASEFSHDAQIADLTNKELEEMDVEGVRKEVDPSNYGEQRVFLDSTLEEGVYKFVLEVYDEDELKNQYWGLTDEKGRKIVQNNDAAKKYNSEAEKFTDKY